jgi:hypothetical protein
MVNMAYEHDYHPTDLYNNFLLVQVHIQDVTDHI